MRNANAVYHSLSPEQREERLLRSGIEAALTEQIRNVLIESVPPSDRASGERQSTLAGTGQGGLENTYSQESRKPVHRQRLKVSVYNLAVLQITLIGAGPGMQGTLLTAGGSQGLGLVALDSEMNLRRDSAVIQGGLAENIRGLRHGWVLRTGSDRMASDDHPPGINGRTARSGGELISSTAAQRSEGNRVKGNDSTAGGRETGVFTGQIGGSPIPAYRSACQLVHVCESIGEREQRLTEDSSRENVPWATPERGRRLRRAVEGMAIRALYALGLDSGEVLLIAMGERRYVVERVTPLEPAPGTPLPEPYASAALALSRSLAEEQPGRPGLLMGMDPEFLLLRVDTGRVVPASRYLPLTGVAGCDAGPPGTRGAFPVAELRPEPRGEPRALLAQLMSAAATADRLLPAGQLAWRAGGMPLPGWALGGHLHFSGVTLTAPLLRALDNYLALPVMLLEDARSVSRRPRYGVLGDFRYQPHGGFEYRTLPSFLVSPVIAKGVVHLAYLIVSHYEDLMLAPLDREELHAAYYRGDRTPLRAAFQPLAAQLRTLGGYERAARYIEPLFRYIAAGRTWDEARDIRALWCKVRPRELTK